MRVSEAGDRILEHHRRLGTRLPSLLRPGLSDLEIGRQAQAAGLRLPSDVHDLFGWRDGTDATSASLGEMTFFHRHHLLSLEDAVSLRSSLRALRPPSWLPIASDGAGTSYLVDCQASPAPVLMDDPELGYMGTPIFESVSVFFAAIEACFSRGGCHVGPEGWLEVNDGAWAKIGKQVGVPGGYWDDLDDAATFPPAEALPSILDLLKRKDR
jgi:cell wall assembly regulator SMI1